MKAAFQQYGKAPVMIMQLTHSGRFSKPLGRPSPLLGCHDPYLDERYRVPADEPLVPDSTLDALPERYAGAAMLARKAGFHGVDVKACHRYLLWK